MPPHDAAHDDMRARLGEVSSSGAPQAHMAGWVASILRTRISEGAFLPGAKLSEEHLASALGVSRNTLREAFTTLSAESIVTRIPNRGVFVARPGPNEVREMYRARRLLEPAAVLWGELTPGVVRQLDELCALAFAARDREDGVGMADANQAFHAAIVAMAESEHFTQLMNSLLAEMRLVFELMTSPLAFHEGWAKRNADIVELLRAGKRERAAAELRAYLDEAEAALLTQLGDAPSE